MKKLIILLSLPLLFSCGRKSGIKELRNISGTVFYEGKVVPNAYITNISKGIRVKADGQGRFTIQADKGDKILFESEDKSYFLVVGSDSELQINLKPNHLKVFHFRNFESDMFQGEIFVFIQFTKFVSPVLSDGTVVFVYPEGATEFFIVANGKYTRLKIGDIEDFSVLDFKKLDFSPLPDSVPVENSSGVDAKLVSYTGAVSYVYAGQITYVRPGLYKVYFDDGSVIDNIFIYDSVELKGGMMKKEEPMKKFSGSAKTHTEEGDVLIWVEGSDIISKSSPQFSIDIPAYSKRVYFSKFAWFPYVVDLESWNSSEIKLSPQSYISGRILSFEPLTRVYIDIIDEGGNVINSYFFKSTDFTIIVPSSSSFLLSVSSPGYVPKLLNFSAQDYYIDLGEIYLCKPDDEICIIEEGKKFLSYGLYRKARESFLYSNSVSGKIGLVLADIGILVSEENILSFSENSKKKSLSELSQIYDEIDSNISINISEPLCFERILVSIPIFFRGFLSGCVSKNSFDFFVSAYLILKFLRNYVYAHKLPDEFNLIADFLNTEQLRNLGLMLAKDKELFTFSSGFDVEENLGILKRAFLTLGSVLASSPPCSSSDDMICSSGDFIFVRSGATLFTLFRKDADIPAFVRSLSGEYELSLADIFHLVPFNPPFLPDFLRLNLKNLLSNPLRKFIPSVLDKDSGLALGIEVEVPSGYKGIVESGFIDQFFVVGESKHFRVSGDYLVDYDGVFPQSSTSYFEDILKEEFIIYFYFDDPTFGKGLKISPCFLTINEILSERYNCPDSSYLYPDNQMLNDSLASFQKFTGIFKNLFGTRFFELFGF